MKAMTRILGMMAALALAASAGASPLTAGGDYTGTTHTFENHQNQNLTGIILDFANLTGTSFRNTIFTNGSFISADLSLTNLRDTVFLNANLTGATLSGALMRNTDFTNANLSGVTMLFGNVFNADFSGANLAGANLTGTFNYNNATWTGATYDALTILPAGMNAAALGLTFVAEPSTALLLLAGLAGLAAFGTRGRPLRE